MDKQRYVRRSVGNDTHVRSIENNFYQRYSRSCFELVTGEVSMNMLEPLYRQNSLNIDLAQGGSFTKIPMPGAFIDPQSGNLHGNYEGLIPGQMVLMGFVNGNMSSPIVLNRYPYQGKANTLNEIKFINPMFLQGFDAQDVLMGHYSGSLIGLYTGLNPLGGRLPGTIGIDAVTNLEITTGAACTVDAKSTLDVSAAGDINIASNSIFNLKSGEVKVEAKTVTMNGNDKVSVSSGTIELNGSNDAVVLFNRLKAAIDSLVEQLNSHTHTDSQGVLTSPVIVPLTCDISAASSTTVKIGS